MKLLIFICIIPSLSRISIRVGSGSTKIMLGVIVVSTSWIISDCSTRSSSKMEMFTDCTCVVDSLVNVRLNGTPEKSRPADCEWVVSKFQQNLFY